MQRARLSIIGQRLEQERLRRGWTQEYVAEQLGVDPVTLRRWERAIHLPQAIYHHALCTLYHTSPQELGLLDEPQTKEDTDPSSLGQVALIVPIGTAQEGPDAYSAFRSTDLSTQFYSLVGTWPFTHPSARYSELQLAIIAVLEQGDNTMTDDLMDRREALRRLASLPIEMCGLSLLGPVLVRPMEDILTQCAAGITACWYLRKGKDLAFPSDAVSRYIPTLKEIAATGSTAQRKTSAELLVQCFLLKATLSWDFTNPDDATAYAQSASVYARAAENVTLQIIALRTQAAAHSFAHRWEQALERAEKAAHLLETSGNTSIPPLVYSYVYAGLATYRAYSGQKQDALTALGKAHTTFFAQPSDKIPPIWIDHSIGNLLINDAETHVHLGLYKQAIDSFEQIHKHFTRDTATSLAIPLACDVTARIEQVLAEVNRDDQSRDMEWCITHWTQGMHEAILLQSTLKFNEAVQAYTAMRGAWPAEQRIKDLREQMVHW